MQAGRVRWEAAAARLISAARPQPTRPKSPDSSAGCTSIAGSTSAPIPPTQPAPSPAARHRGVEASSSANSGPLGTGTLTMAGGSIYARGPAQAIANPIVLSNDVAISGTNPLTLNGNMSLLSLERIVTVNASLATFNGAITGT